MIDFDHSLLTLLLNSRRMWLDEVMLLASALGAGGFIWWVTAMITMVFPNKRAAAWRMILVIAFTYLISDVSLKSLIARDRPFTVDPAIIVIDARPSSSAFPSGHAAMAAAGALAGSRMLPGSAWVWWPFALVVAISRVYIGVHWPSDVIGGVLIGVACAWFVLGGRKRH